MNLHLFCQGLAIGFFIAVPVGPIGVLCIRRSIAQGIGYGFISGLGAATADALYGAIAVFGLTLVANLLANFQMLLQLFGGAFLCCLGYYTYISKTANCTLKPKDRSLFAAYMSVLFLTLTNPMTILAFVGIFAALGIGPDTSDYFTVGVFLLGVFGGSTLWWFMLSGTMGLLRTNFSRQQLILINKGSGIVICCFGIIVLVNLLRSTLLPYSQKLF